MRAWYIREQKHILGTSDYAEVDLFETTDKEHTASTRRKRELATSIAQQKYNDMIARRYADGTVEVVEVKSKFTRRQQRDYIHRRRMFIDLVAEPQHWRFIEHITPDTAEEIRKWKRLAEQAGKDSSWEKAGRGCQHSTGRASRMQ